MKTISLLLFCWSLMSIAQAQSVVMIGQGNNLNSVSATASSQSNSAMQTLTNNGYLPNTSAASRFLSQATMGHNMAHIQGINECWL